MGLSFDDVKDMALQGAQLVRDPTQSEVDAFRLAMGEGGKGWIVFPRMLLEEIRVVLLDQQLGSLDKVCPNWEAKGINGSQRCSIVKSFGLATCTWETWIVRFAYIQFLQKLTGDTSKLVCSMDALAFGVLQHESHTSTTTAHVDMSFGSPSHKLEERRLAMGIEFPCLQAQINLFQHPHGTQLWFGKRLPCAELPVNKHLRDYTKVNEEVTHQAHVETGSVVLWQSNVVHATRKSNIKGLMGLSRCGIFVCAYWEKFRSDHELRSKFDLFMKGCPTCHLPTMCIKGGGRNHMSNNPARSESFCVALPEPTDPIFIEFVRTMI